MMFPLLSARLHRAVAAVALLALCTLAAAVLATAPDPSWTRVVNLSIRVNPRDASDKTWDPDYSPGIGFGPFVLFGGGFLAPAPDLIVCVVDENARSYCHERRDGRSKPKAFAPNALETSLPGERVPAGYFGVIVFDVDWYDEPPPYVKLVLATVISPQPEIDYDRVQRVEAALQQESLRHGVVGMDHCHKDPDGRTRCTPRAQVPNQFAVKFIGDVSDCATRDSLDPVCALPSPSAGVVTIVDAESDEDAQWDSFVPCGQSMWFAVRSTTEDPGSSNTLAFAAGQQARCSGRALYRWDFGDGHVALTSTPDASHTYERSGEFAVSTTFTCSGDVRTCFTKASTTVTIAGGQVR